MERFVARRPATTKVATAWFGTPAMGLWCLFALACTSNTEPQGSLAVQVRGRLERGAIVQVAAERDGVLVPDSSVTWSVDPPEAAVLLPGGRARLVRSGNATFKATVGRESGMASVSIATPPTIVFDLLRDGNRDIYRAALDGQDLFRLTADPAEDLDPAAAAGLVVFVSFRNGNGELYAVPLAGGPATRLTNTASQEDAPALSPDGKRIAYTSYETGVPKLWLANVNGGQAARANTSFSYAGSADAGPSWAPTSDRLVFVSTNSGVASLYQFTVSDAQVRLLRSDQNASVEPAWSPDGNRIAFASDRGGATGLYLLDLTSGSLTRLTEGPATSGQPTWLPDGRLVYVTWLGGVPRLGWLDPAEPNVTYEINIGPGLPGHPSGVFE
jgi:TolB protein